MDTQITSAINVRYSELAESSCCLSCGGAINHSKASAGEVCVDLGSGRGHDVLRLAETVGPEGFVYGVDISDGMLQKAQKNAQKLEVTNVEFRKSDLEQLPLDRDSVNLLISNCTINHAKDKQQVWNEVYRVLLDGGRFVVSDIYSLQPVPDEYRDDPVAVAECWAGSVTRDVYAAQLEQAGFTDVTILEESDAYEKGAIEVVSWTILGYKNPKVCSCHSKST
ncbi:MAG: methyltransferase domain-containing protein [Spirochaetia bacterium]|nr:methyltransferase domain-containing protein [Spirochaetia bacterium]